MKNKFTRKSKSAIVFFSPSDEPRPLTYTGKERANRNSIREYLEQLLYETPEQERSERAAAQHSTLGELTAELNRLKLYERKAEELERLNARIAELELQLFGVPGGTKPELHAELQRLKIALNEFWRIEQTEPQRWHYPGE